MTSPQPAVPPAFGEVDFEGEHGLLTVESGPGALCRLTLLARTERGYPRRELATIPAATWRELATAIQRELLRGMDPEEQGPRPPSLRSGENALSPLILRELAVLFWSLMEDGEGTHIKALLAGWRQLAREERWWLYARASSSAQRQGQGWRRALYYALTDPSDTRTAPRLLEIMEAATAQKKRLAAEAGAQLSGGTASAPEETDQAGSPAGAVCRETGSAPCQTDQGPGTPDQITPDDRDLPLTQPRQLELF